MGNFNSPPYRNATAIGNKLLQLIVKCVEPSKEAALLTRAWIDIEAFKREMRGVPRLLGASTAELLAYRREAMKRANDANAPAYIDEEPDPLPPTAPPTVTAPPTP